MLYKRLSDLLSRRHRPKKPKGPSIKEVIESTKDVNSLEMAWVKRRSRKGSKVTPAAAKREKKALF